MPISAITSELVNELIQARGQKIKKLNLSDNCLSVVENLDPLTHLQKLDLSRNKFTGEARSIGGLASLRSLVVLDLSNNAIEELKYIGTALGPLGVKHLSLKNNRIENLEQLQHLNGQQSLAILELERNAVVKKDGYREFLVNTLPWLQKLDGEPLRYSAAVETAVESSIHRDQTSRVGEGKEDEEKLSVLNNSQHNTEGAPTCLSSTASNHGDGDGRSCMQPGLLPMSNEPPTDSVTTSEQVANHILSEAISLAVDSAAHSVMSTGLPGPCSNYDDYLLGSQGQRRENSMERKRKNPIYSVVGKEKCIPVLPNPRREEASGHRHDPFFHEPVDEVLAPISTISSPSDVCINDVATAAATNTPAGLLKNTPNGMVHSQQQHQRPPLKFCPPWLPLQPPQNSMGAPTDSLQPFPGTTLPARPPSGGMKSKVISPLERSRQMSLCSSRSQSFSQDNVNRTACDDEKDMKISSLMKEVDLLSAENKALRNSISSHHEALVVRCLGSSRHHRPEDIPPLSENVNNGSLVCDAEDNYYVKLLNCWRREVLQLLAEKELHQVEQRKRLSEIEESTRNGNRRCSKLEKLLLAAESRVDAAEAGLALSKDRNNALSMELSRSQSRCSIFEAECARRRDLEAKMLQGLFAFQENVNFKYRDHSEGLASALSMLKGFEARISVAHHRVQLVAALQRQKEVHLRNCRAAFEADKRVWHLERERREMAALSEAAATMTAETHHSSASSSYRRPNGFVCGLQPECEAAMRSVFCHLDKQGVGEVEWEGLLQALRDDSGIMALMTNILGKHRWAAALASIESQLIESQVQQISWGEFLLFFIPTSSRRYYSSGNQHLPSLYNSNFWPSSKAPPGWREICESLPMLQLDVPLAYRTVATLPTTDDLSTQELRKEVRRLCQERTFLMEMLREESTVFMQRSEDIYDLFRHELRVARGNMETCRAESAAIRDELTMELRKVRELEYSLKEENANQARSDDTWKRRFELSSAAQESSLKTAEKEFQKRVDTQKDFTMSLNEDISSLHQELAKANVAKQSLDHQLSRAKKSAEDALRDLKEDLCGRIAARDRELTTVRRERNSLLSIVRDQQQKGFLKFGATGDTLSCKNEPSSSSSEVFRMTTGTNRTKEELVQHAEETSAIAGILLEATSSSDSNGSECITRDAKEK